MTPRRVFWIACGILAGILVIVIVVVSILMGVVINRSQDPQAIESTRSKFGTFNVPEGYRTSFAFDNWPLKTVVIQPNGSSDRKVKFVILLSKMAPLDFLALGRPRAHKIKLSPTRPRFAKCRRVTAFPDESIRSGIGVVVLRHARCADSDLDQEGAAADIEMPNGRVTVIGRGPHEAFDLPAIRDLLRSFR